MQRGQPIENFAFPFPTDRPVGIGKRRKLLLKLSPAGSSFVFSHSQDQFGQCFESFANSRFQWASFPSLFQASANSEFVPIIVMARIASFKSWSPGMRATRL